MLLRIARGLVAIGVARGVGWASRDGTHTRININIRQGTRDTATRELQLIFAPPKLLRNVVATPRIRGGWCNDQKCHQVTPNVRIRPHTSPNIYLPPLSIYWTLKKEQTAWLIINFNTYIPCPRRD